MTIGSKRLVVGAHYGLRDWLLQRVTAAVLAAYTLLVVALSVASEPGYDGWARLFAPTWMKVLTLIAVASLAYHAWIGVRDIWMDYVKPTGLRLTLQVLTVLWLLACVAWAVQVLWRV
ncbi:MAG: succinate dehydrogenase, hydrophobic membrane anchor protein [Burkholderiaceae bacterium]|nr:succinate dehydrogenase, hydrophobic membrane anchor protein [Burkholderiaceae bacterium]